MTPIVNEAQAKLIPLAFDLNNRIWMEGYVLCCSFLENAAQILQIQNDKRMNWISPSFCVIGFLGRQEATANAQRPTGNSIDHGLLISQKFLFLNFVEFLKPSGRC